MKALLKLEVLGFPGPPKKWPVRYCADMLVSGHTFVVLLYLLGLADLVRQVSLLYSPSTSALAPLKELAELSQSERFSLLRADDSHRDRLLGVQARAARRYTTRGQAEAT